MFIIVNIVKGDQDNYDKSILIIDSANEAKAELHKIIGRNYDQISASDNDAIGFVVSMLDAHGFSVYNESVGMDDIPQPLINALP